MFIKISPSNHLSINNSTVLWRFGMHDDEIDRSTELMENKFNLKKTKYISIGAISRDL